MLCLSTHRNHHWRVKTSTLLLGQSNWFCATDIFARGASSFGLFQYNLQIIKLKKDTFLLCVRARIEWLKNTVPVWQKIFYRKNDLSDWFKWSQMILITKTSAFVNCGRILLLIVDILWIILCRWSPNTSMLSMPITETERIDLKRRRSLIPNRYDLMAMTLRQLGVPHVCFRSTAFQLANCNMAWHGTATQ